MRSDLIVQIAEDLASAYGEPQSADRLPLHNKRDPLDELIYIMLTVMTQFGVDGVWDQLRVRFPSWRAVLEEPPEVLTALLQPIGLSSQRALRIRAALAEIVAREGAADLRRLEQLPDDEVETYLTTLPGVGKKVARCVMLYSLGRRVFPVDAHALRVLKRLGLADQALTLSAAQDVLQPRVPDVLRYTLHVNLVVHGRTTCRARHPLCDQCCLRGMCPSRMPA